MSNRMSIKEARKIGIFPAEWCEQVDELETQIDTCIMALRHVQRVASGEVQIAADEAMAYIDNYLKLTLGS
jgi:hypothetical protein